MSMQIPLQRPTFDEAEEKAVAEVLRSGWVTQGPMVARFEQQIADYVGVEHAVAVTSATTALQVGLMAMGIGEGDEVVCPSYSYIATPNSIIHAGATPVFADIESQYWSLDPAAVEAKITSRTKAIMPVHMGYPADLDGIYEVARRHNLAVIEDAAPAIGAHYKDRLIGDSDGPVIFSFHPRKTITTGEGGMITTNDAAVAEKLRLLRHHYMSISDLVRHSSSAVTFESYEDIGYNMRMTDLQAAVGVAQLAKLDAILAERSTIAKQYDDAFAAVHGLAVLVTRPQTTNSYQNYLVEVKSEAKLSRNEVMSALQRQGITTRRGIMSSHLEPAYQKRFGKVSLPVSEYVSANTMMLPVFSGMTEEEVDHVINSVQSALG